MRPVYTDLYALFRRDPGAEEYFNQLPAYVQDQLSARCRACLLYTSPSPRD